VERHEAAEFFALDADKPGGGARPYAPHHQPGADPYTVFELGTAEEAATSFRGTVNPTKWRSCPLWASGATIALCPMKREMYELP
jgi:hypothetical protein